MSFHLRGATRQVIDPSAVAVAASGFYSRPPPIPYSSAMNGLIERAKVAVHAKAGRTFDGIDLAS